MFNALHARLVLIECTVGQRTATTRSSGSADPTGGSDAFAAR
jgi:hypothetical protein